MSDHVQVCEVGPRDGLQIAKGIMPTAVKLRWIDALAKAGVSHMEVGSFVPPSLIPQMADTAEVLDHSLKIPTLTSIVLVPNEKGAQRAYAAGATHLVIPVSVSDSHSRSNIRKGTFEQVAEVGRIVEWLKTQDRKVHVEPACATAFGCSFEGVVPETRVIEVAEALLKTGADTVSLADTLGYGHPGQIRSLVRKTRAAIGPAFERLHLHDTLGMGMANALAGVEEGVRAFDSALAGLGGCPFAPGAAGNIVTEDLVFMLESLGLKTGIDLDALIEARAYIAEGLPGEKLHGQVPAAGLPKTFQKAA